MKWISLVMVVGCLVFAAAAAADGPIVVSDTTIANDYPDRIVFEVEASSSAAPIVSAKLNILLRGDSSTAIYPADLAPGRQVMARYEWDPREADVPPGTALQYTWTVRDEAGNSLTSEPVEYVTVDARFTWQVLENEAVALWWYEGEQAFGQAVFDTAAGALEAMQQHTGQALPYRLHVVLYASSADFAAWHDYNRDWVGGEAFSRSGLTVQIVPPGRTQAWIRAVIPHEIAHLFFFQIVYNPMSAFPPTWLNEGFAQYHEFVSHDDDLARVRRAAQRNELIPLRLATGSFTGDDERIHMLYAESLSAVTFLFERWGQAGMQRLLAAYQAGQDTDQALLEATGLNFEEFQQAWWEWLGGSPGAYPTPPASAGVATARPPAERPSVPPPAWTPVPTQSPLAGLEQPAPCGACCPCPCASLLAGLVLLLGLAWRAGLR